MIKKTLIIFVLIVTRAVSAHATVYLHFDANGHSNGDTLPITKARGELQFCQTECLRSGKKDYTVAGGGGASQGESYFQWDTVDSPRNHYAEVKSRGIGVTDVALGQTLYMAWYARFDRGDSGEDIWDEGTTIQAGDKGVETDDYQDIVDGGYLTYNNSDSTEDINSDEDGDNESGNNHDGESSEGSDNEDDNEIALPSVSNATIEADGMTTKVTFDQDVDATEYMDGDFYLSCFESGTLDLSEITGSAATYTLTMENTVYTGDICTLGYTATGIADTAGNILETFTELSVTNNSTQTQASTQAYWVTQNGGATGAGTKSDPYSAVDFNSLGTVDTSKGDAIFYFFGTITSQLSPPSGSSSGFVVLDGYEENDQNPVVNRKNDGSAILNNSSKFAVKIEAKDYITIQDFTITGHSGIYISGSDPGNMDWAEHINFYRNYFHDTKSTAFQQTVKVSGGTYATSGIRYLTLGGSLANGNYFDNCRYNEYESHVFGLNRFEDVIISYNEFGNDDTTSQGGQNNVSLHYGYRYLIEYNKIYKARGQSGISLKEEGAHDGIVRFNHIYDCDGNDARALSVSRSCENVYIYGNRLSTSLRGLGCVKDSENVFVWSNIIDNNKKRGIDIQIATNGNWSLENGHFYNNTIVDNNQASDSGWDSAVFASYIKGDNGIFFANNIVMDNAGSSAYVEMAFADNSAVKLWDNLYYNSKGTPAWVWSTSSWFSDRYTLTEMQALNPAQETDSVIADPNLGKDYIITDQSTEAIDSGSDIEVPNNWDVPIIQDVDYSTEVSLDVALSTDTNWRVRPSPSSIGIVTRTSGLWDKGAYEF